ncbi:hydrogenase-1 protein nickel incorporation factor [Escherichia coli]|nr:hydrogenase-1 protein nickel incorporation factor [Escherichia coli]
MAHELLAHVRNPDAQPHSINLTQLPISEADRLFLSRLCGPGNIQIRTIGYGESYINATGLRHVWHLRCTDTLKGPLLESYEICPIPEVVLAAPEDLVDSAQRLSEVCQWLAEGAPT